MVLVRKMVSFWFNNLVIIRINRFGADLKMKTLSSNPYENGASQRQWNAEGVSYIPVTKNVDGLKSESESGSRYESETE